MEQTVNNELKLIIEAVLMAQSDPVSMDGLATVLGDNEISEEQLRQAIKALQEDYKGRAVELVEVASGYRFQVNQKYRHWVNESLQDKPPRYSQALLETLALIVYKQPITRAEIEMVRGVKVSSQIMKTLVDHGWIQIADYKETPGRPALYTTTQLFLDHFGLSQLSELPAFPELEAILTEDNNESTAIE